MLLSQIHNRGSDWQALLFILLTATTLAKGPVVGRSRQGWRHRHHPYVIVLYHHRYQLPFLAIYTSITKGLFGKNNLRARLFPDYLLGISWLF
jgi:hypothetical protein